MKTIIKLLLAIVTFCLISVPRADAQTLFTYTKVADNYSLREIGAIVCDEAVVQGGVTASLENGAYADIWISKGFESNSCDEQDYTIGYRGTTGEINTHIQVAYFVIPGAPDNVLRIRAEGNRNVWSQDQDTINAFVGIDRLEGLLNTTNFRMGGSWNHDFGDWDSTVTIGATHRDDLGTVSTYGELALSRSFGSWTGTMTYGGFTSPIEGNTTFSIGFSRAW